MKWLDAVQLAQLIDGAGKVSLECLAMVLLGAKAGLRRGEMVGLKWDDVSLDARRLTVRRSTYGTIETAPKSGRFRVVPICAQLGAALAQLARPTEYVLTRTLQNTGCTKERKVPNLKASTGTVHRWMQLACEAAGLTGFGVHSLRHTFCSHLAQRGVSLLLIQRLAGHSDHKITQRYAHFAEQQLVDAVGVL